MHMRKQRDLGNINIFRRNSGLQVEFRHTQYFCPIAGRVFVVPWISLLPEFSHFRIQFLEEV